MKKLITILLLSLALSGQGIAQISDVSSSIERFGGITQLLSCRSVTQGESGRIWFGTDRCLYSFDGYELTPHQAKGSRIIINCIQRYGNGFLLGCNDGLYSYDSRLDLISKTEILDGYGIRAIAEKDGKIYAGTDHGLYMITYNDGVFACVPIYTELDILSILPDSDTIFVGALGGLYTYYPDTGMVRRMPYDINIAIALLKDNDTLWVGTPTSLEKLENGEGMQTEVPGLPVVKAITKDSSGRFLIATDNGLYRHDLKSGSTERISDDIVWSFMSDRDSNIWMASDGGLMMLSQGSHLSRIEGLPVSNIYSNILKDSRGRLWLGSMSGLTMVEDPYSKSPRITQFNVTDPAHQIPHNKIRDIREDKQTGNILVGTDAGFLRYSEFDRAFYTIRLPGNYSHIYGITPDGNTLWLATFTGLYHVRNDGSVIDLYTEQQGLTEKSLSSVAMDSSGNIWVLTQKQDVFVLNVSNGTVSPFNPIPDEHINIDCLKADDEGDIWIAGGNRVFHVNSGSFIPNISEIQIEASSNVETYDMTFSGSTAILCTSEGIFTIDNDLKANSIDVVRRYVSCFYDKESDIVLLGTAGSVEMFSPGKDGFTEAIQGHAPAITKIIVNGSKEIPYDEISSAIINLPAGNNNLRVYISDFSYKSDFTRRYLVELKSFHTHWEEVISDNSIMLPGLKPGLYRLKVRLADSGENIQPADITIRIRHPWYMSWYMILLYLAVIIIVVYGGRRFAALRRKLNEEEQQHSRIVEQEKQKVRREMAATPDVKGSERNDTSTDEKFIQKVTQIIEAHLDDSGLNVTKLCELGDFNEKQLYRRLKQHTGMSIVEYIRSIRLKKAASMLSKGTYTIAEVMYAVGFSSASYFTRTFSAAYGQTPSEFIKKNQKQQ